jgi:hypothetical protein
MYKSKNVTSADKTNIKNKQIIGEIFMFKKRTTASLLAICMFAAIFYPSFADLPPIAVPPIGSNILYSNNMMAAVPTTGAAGVFNIASAMLSKNVDGMTTVQTTSNRSRDTFLTDNLNPTHIYGWYLAPPNGANFNARQYAAIYQPEAPLTDFNLSYDWQNTDMTDIELPTADNSDPFASPNAPVVFLRTDGTAENGYKLVLYNNAVFLRDDTEGGAGLLAWAERRYKPPTMSRDNGSRLYDRLTSWCSLQASVEGNKINIYIDGDLILEYTDTANLYTEGSIAFAGVRHRLFVDNLVIEKLGNDLTAPAVYPRSGLYASAQDVKLIPKNPGASIYYTLDGSEPSPSAAGANLYVNPLQIDADTTIKCAAYADGRAASEVAVYTYEFTDHEIKLNLERVYLKKGDVTIVTAIFGRQIEKANVAYTFSSTDASVVSVHPELGIITAVGAGTADIVANTYKGKAASCAVTVSSDCSSFYYVDTDNGDDSYPGTFTAPFASIGKARDTIRALGGDIPNGGIIVYLREGNYYLEDTLIFTPDDSGKPGAPIVYASYPGENACVNSGVRIDGFTLLTGDFPAGLPETSKGQVYAADIKPGWLFHDLYADG